MEGYPPKGKTMLLYGISDELEKDEDRRARQSLAWFLRRMCLMLTLHFNAYIIHETDAFTAVSLKKTMPARLRFD